MDLREEDEGDSESNHQPPVVETPLPGTLVGRGPGTVLCTTGGGTCACFRATGCGIEIRRTPLREFLSRLDVSYGDGDQEAASDGET